MFSDENRARMLYGPALERSEGRIDEKARGDACIECGERSECLRSMTITEAQWIGTASLRWKSAGN